MRVNLASRRSRRDLFQHLYQAIEREQALNGSLSDDEGLVAGIYTDPRDGTVYYAERLSPDVKYFGIFLRPSFSKQLPRNPMKLMQKSNKLEKKLTHCTGKLVTDDLSLADCNSPKDVASQVKTAVQSPQGTVETYQTLHNRGQLLKIYEEYVESNAPA